MKHTLKHTNPLMQQRSFTYYVKDYDSKTKIYTLENPITKEIKTMDKAQFEKMHAEQHHAPAGDASHKILDNHKK